jgi:cytosine/adenosine deaminase-related metal-dependent hydrolase
MRYISSSFVFDGKKFLNGNPILVLDDNNNFIDFADKNSIDKNNIEFYEGIICPGFINAHCHLELSHMLGAIPEKTGFLNFGKNIMSRRNSFSREEILEAISANDKKMWENGIVAVGDISNTTDAFETKAKSNIFYHTFIELIALNPERAEMTFSEGKKLQALANENGLKSSLAPHAPYSVSGELMKMIAGDSDKNEVPITIHNQENQDEDLFFQKKEGDFVEFYKFLNIPIDYFQPTGLSSLQSYLQNLVSSRNLILVHNTFTPTNEIKWANDIHKNNYWCTCPNANLYIENKLPDLKKFIDNDCRMVIGTDSLASNYTLSVTDEINVLLNNFKWLKIADVLRWATYNGAEALGIENQFGGFIKGKNAGLNHLSYKPDQLVFEQKLA